MSDKFLTTAEAAEILGVTRWRINKMIQSGRLNAEKFNRFYLIKEDELKSVENRKPGRPVKKIKVE